MNVIQRTASKEGFWSDSMVCSGHSFVEQETGTHVFILNSELHFLVEELKQER